MVVTMTDLGRRKAAKPNAYPYRLVLVDWEDSGQPVPSWRYVTDMPRPTPIKCSSVGWLVQETKEAILLAPNVGEIGTDAEQACGVMVIPVSAVLRMKNLRA